MQCVLHRRSMQDRRPAVNRGCSAMPMQQRNRKAEYRSRKIVRLLDGGAFKTKACPAAYIDPHPKIPPRDPASPKASASGSSLQERNLFSHDVTPHGAEAREGFGGKTTRGSGIPFRASGYVLDGVIIADRAILAKLTQSRSTVIGLLQPTLVEAGLRVGCWDSSSANHGLTTHQTCWDVGGKPAGDLYGL
ncbi:hypothetical protein CLAIMM_09994 [Cladophialophora immunda]|nr:hypothetical protein CLAIMM_09994 [Cladophialophora immunda]